MVCVNFWYVDVNGCKGGCLFCVDLCRFISCAKGYFIWRQQQEWNWRESPALARTISPMWIGERMSNSEFLAERRDFHKRGMVGVVS